MSVFISMLFSALVQLCLFSLIPFIWWLITARKENFFTWLGLKKPKLSMNIAKPIVIIVVSCAAYIAAMAAIGTYMLDPAMSASSQFSGDGIGALPQILLYAVIQTSLSEEIFFRGFLCKRLSGKLGFVAGNMIQSLLFGLMHGIPFGLATGNIMVCILCTFLPGAIGYIQGWLNEKCAGGSIFPSWILHALMNTLSALSVAI